MAEIYEIKVFYRNLKILLYEMIAEKKSFSFFDIGLLMQNRKLVFENPDK